MKPLSLIFDAPKQVLLLKEVLTLSLGFGVPVVVLGVEVVTRVEEDEDVGVGESNIRERDRMSIAKRTGRLGRKGILFGR